MILNETAFAQRLGPAGLRELKDLAGKYGMTVSDICRLGYEAETGPYRYHIWLTDEEVAWLDDQAREAGVSRSHFLMKALVSLIDEHEEDLLKHIQLPLDFSATRDICVSFNNIDFIMKLSEIESETGETKKLILRTLFAFLQRFSEKGR